MGKEKFSKVAFLFVVTILLTAILGLGAYLQVGLITDFVSISLVFKLQVGRTGQLPRSLRIAHLSY